MGPIICPTCGEPQPFDTDPLINERNVVFAAAALFQFDKPDVPWRMALTWEKDRYRHMAITALRVVRVVRDAEDREADYASGNGERHG